MQLKPVIFRAAATAALAATLIAPTAAQGNNDDSALKAGDLLVSGSIYQPPASVPAELPPGCAPGACTPAATSDTSYPYVFNNDTADSSFGITTPIDLWELNKHGKEKAHFQIPTDQLVTSFSSKSELALNDSISKKAISFMGYVAPPGAFDVSNSNTPREGDPTNPVSSAYYRAAAVLKPSGDLNYTETNAYSGNNGRAALLNDGGASNLIYTAGNAGNGANPQPKGVVIGAGAQIMNESFAPESSQNPGDPTPVGSFNINEVYPTVTDKNGKDDNFRGLTEYNNVLYYTKGSGSNGINTVYFLDTTGNGCATSGPGAGIGVPSEGASLPTTSLNTSTATTTGLPDNMCILRGFNTARAKTATNGPNPFGMFFANKDTLYVADEGNGADGYDPNTNTWTNAASSPFAGLEKWIWDPVTGQWYEAYVMQRGLNLGTPYPVAGYPTGTNSATNLPWAPATDGLRNITGRVSKDGKVTIYGITSTVSGSGDQGADPNKLVKITDDIGATTADPNQSFETVRTAAAGQVLRGVAFVPRSENSDSKSHSLRRH